MASPQAPAPAPPAGPQPTTTTTTKQSEAQKKLDADWKTLLARLEAVHSNLDNTEIYVTASRADTQKLSTLFERIRRRTANPDPQQQSSSSSGDVGGGGGGGRSDALSNDLLNLARQADRIAGAFQLVRFLLLEAADPRHEKSCVKKMRFVAPDGRDDGTDLLQYTPNDGEMHTPHAREDRAGESLNETASSARLASAQRNKTLQETLALIRGFGSNARGSNLNDEGDDTKLHIGNPPPRIEGNVERYDDTKLRIGNPPPLIEELVEETPVTEQSNTNEQDDDLKLHIDNAPPPIEEIVEMDDDTKLYIGNARSPIKEVVEEDDDDTKLYIINDPPPFEEHVEEDDDDTKPYISNDPPPFEEPVEEDGDTKLHISDDTPPIEEHVEEMPVETTLVTKQSTSPPLAVVKETPTTTPPLPPALPEPIPTNIPVHQEAPDDIKSPVSPSGAIKLKRTVTDLYKSEWIWYAKPYGIPIQDFVQAQLDAEAASPPAAKRKRPETMMIPEMSDTESDDSDETMRGSIPPRSAPPSETVEMSIEKNEYETGVVITDFATMAVP